MAYVPSPPLCPTQENNWKMCRMPSSPLSPSPHQKNFIESVELGMHELMQLHDSSKI